MKKGFTLVELLVVIGMIAVIAAAMVSGVAGAQQRAKISRANTETREITNAILAYANYDEEGGLRDYLMQDTEATESTLGFILGKATGRGGTDVPVLYNAALSGSERAILDPWGKPYRVTIKEGETVSPPGIQNMRIRLFFPNWNRLSEGER